jgi:hypothetical protein
MIPNLHEKYQLRGGDVADVRLRRTNQYCDFRGEEGGCGAYQELVVDTYAKGINSFWAHYRCAKHTPERWEYLPDPS